MLFNGTRIRKIILVGNKIQSKGHALLELVFKSIDDLRLIMNDEFSLIEY
jgi:hypothetical protein